MKRNICKRIFSLFMAVVLLMAALPVSLAVAEEGAEETSTEAVLGSASEPETDAGSGAAGETASVASAGDSSAAAGEIVSETTAASAGTNAGTAETAAGTSGTTTGAAETAAETAGMTTGTTETAAETAGTTTGTTETASGTGTESGSGTAQTGTTEMEVTEAETDGTGSSGSADGAGGATGTDNAEEQQEETAVGLTLMAGLGAAAAAYTVTEIEALAEEISLQEVAVGATEADITFPETLNVTVTADGGVTMAQAEISVTWVLDTSNSYAEAFAGAQDGEWYYYDASLPESDEEGNTYTLAEGVVLPFICVQVGSMAETIAEITYDENGFGTDGDTTYYQPAVMNSGVYEIGNAGQLFWFAALVNGDTSHMEEAVSQNMSAQAVLTGNITIPDGYTWTPIGNYGADDTSEYMGIFNGNENSISGLSVSTNENYQGLFGYIGAAYDYSGGGFAVTSSGTVKDVTVVGSVTGSSYVGGVAGYNAGTVSGCGSFVTVSGSDCVGGVAGHNNGTVTDCKNYGTVTGNSRTGGVTGYNTGTVSGSANSAAVTGTTVGGVVGNNDSGSVSACTNTGTVTCTSENNNASAGGVVGYNYVGTITGCTNSANVSGGRYTGGVVGWQYYATTGLSGCTNSGGVSGRYYVGGVIGHNYDSKVSGCANSGSVTVTGSSGCAGGVVGWNLHDTNGSACTVASCYNVGTVTGTNAGCLAGRHDGAAMSDCYYLGADTSTGISYSSGGTTSNISYASEGDFKSGAVAYLLNGSSSESGNIIWYQNLDNGATVDSYPVTDSSHGTVYYGMNCTGTGVYSNTSISALGHQYDQYGFCKVCGTYEPATLENEVYQIKNAGNLYWFAALVNGTISITNSSGDSVTLEGISEKNLSASAVLLNDIDLNPYVDTLGEPGTMEWTPIGNYASSSTLIYSGTFDGNEKTISGLFIASDSAEKYQALFGRSNGTVKDLTVSGTISGAGMYCGGVVGANGGKVENCCNKVNISSDSGYAGGVVGYNSGTVDRCCNEVDISSSGSSVGGVAGYSIGTVSSCYNTGNVSGSNYVGGVVGRIYNTNGTVSNCYNTGSISGSSYVGGVAGYSNGTVDNSYNDTGSVSGSNYVGGVVGHNTGTVNNSYNSTGAVSGSKYVGGVAGYIAGTVDNSYNTGTVSGSDSDVGGVVGRSTANGIVTSCYNTGNVSNGTNIGGVAGNNLGTVNNSYNTGEISGSYVGGVVGINGTGTGNAIVSSCYSTGNVSGSGYVGGVVGYNQETVSNSYYLSTAATAATGSGSTTGTEARTEAQFASGEVAWLLQNGQTGSVQVWGQDLTGRTMDADDDKYPVFASDADRKVVQVSFYLAASGKAADTPFSYGYTNAGQTLAGYPSGYTFYTDTGLTNAVSTDAQTFSADTPLYTAVVYTLRAEVTSTAAAYNPYDTIKADIYLTANADTTVTAATIAFAGDWYTVTGAVGLYGASDTVVWDGSTGKVSIAYGSAISASTTETKIATVVLTVNADAATNADAEIEFNLTGSYIGELEAVPVSAKAPTVAVCNLILTLSSGDGAGFASGTGDPTTMYLKYNESGIYSDAARKTKITEITELPSATAAAGYELKDGYWTLTLAGAGSGSQITAADLLTRTWTASATAVPTALKQYTVTITAPEAQYGTITYANDAVSGTKEVTVNEETSYSEILSEIRFTAADSTGYVLNDWKSSIDSSTVSAETTAVVTGNTTLTPNISAGQYRVVFEWEQNSLGALATPSESGFTYEVKDGVLLYYGTYGTDAKFQIQPSDGYAVYSVTCTVGGAAETLAADADGNFTIPGGKITGEVTVELVTKKYYEVTFSGGTGSSMTSGTYYAWDGIAGLYSTFSKLGLSGSVTAADTISGNLAPDISESANGSRYRLAEDTDAEPLWTDASGTATTAELLSSRIFTADTACTANAVQQYLVTFADGADGFGSYAGGSVLEIWRDSGSAVSADAIPAVNAADYYEFAHWSAGSGEYTTSDLADLVISAPVTVTPVFSKINYSVTFMPGGAGTFTAISGVSGTDGAYTAQNGVSNITFRFTADGNYRVTDISFTVDGGTPVSLGYEAGKTCTIAAADITGDIEISVEAEAIRTYTFAIANDDAAKGTLGSVAAVVTKVGEKPDLTGVAVTAGAGYTFMGWTPDGGTTVVSAEEIADEQVTASTDNRTYTAVFTRTDLSVSYNAALVASIDGLENGCAHIGTDLVITPADGFVFLSVSSAVGTGVAQAAAENQDGTWTIDGSTLTDSVTITITANHAAPAAGEGYTVNYSGETAAAESSYEISLDGSDWSSGSLAVTPGGTLYVRKSADANAGAGEPTSNVMASRPAAPTGIVGVNEEWKDESDGQITGVTAEMEYRLSGDSAWTSCEGTAITGLAAGSYEVRLKATANAFAGEAASVTIASGTERTYTLNVSAPVFAEVSYGYAQPGAQSIIISNSGNSDATITGIEIDNTAYFAIAGSGDSVPAGGSVETWTVRPAAGLAKGTYSGTITVTYNGGATATAEVTFTVNAATPTVTLTGIVEDTTYNGKKIPDPTVSVTLVNGETYNGTPAIAWYAVAGDGTETLLAAPPSDAGSYRVVVTVSDAGGNYTAVSASAKFIISAAAQTIDIEGFSNILYDGAAHEVTVIVDPEATVEITYEDADGNTVAAPVNAGTYTAHVTVTRTNYITVNQDVSVSIVKAAPKISVAGVVSKTHDGIAASDPTVTVELAGGETYSGTPAITWYAVAEDGTETLLAATPSDSGSYKAVITVGDAGGNYEIVSEELDFIIFDAEQNVEITGFAGIPYDGERHEVTVEADEDAAATITYEDAEGNAVDAPVNAGTYTAHITVTRPNHADLEQDVTVSIAKAVPTVSLTGVATRTYDGTAESEPTVSVTLAGGETYSGTHDTAWYSIAADGTETLLDGAPSAAGTYKVTVTVSAGDNYETALASAEFTILEVEQILNIIGFTDIPYDGEPHEVTVTADADAAVTITYTDADGNAVAAPVDAGVYIAHITIEKNGSVMAEEDVEVSIVKAAQSISWLDDAASVTKTIGDSPFTVELMRETVYGTVSYESSDTSVATVDENGCVTIVGVGMAVITAAVSGNENYSAAETSYTLIVSAASGSDPEENNVDKSSLQSAYDDSLGLAENDYTSGSWAALAAAREAAKAVLDDDGATQEEVDAALAALNSAAAGLVKASSELPDETGEPESTESPDETEEPESTESPDETEETDKPDSTDITSTTESTESTDATESSDTGSDSDVQTGDETNILLWIALMVLAAAGLAAETVYSRKKKPGKEA